MMDKNELQAFTEKIVSETPELFPAIRPSLIREKFARDIIAVHPEYIQYVKKPSYELCALAVQLMPSAIILIPDKFMKSLRLSACIKEPELLQYFMDESWSKKELTELITKKPSAVRYFKSISESYVDMACKLDPNLDLYFRK